MEVSKWDPIKFNIACDNTIITNNFPISPNNLSYNAYSLSNGNDVLIFGNNQIYLYQIDTNTYTTILSNIVSSGDAFYKYTVTYTSNNLYYIFGNANVSYCSKMYCYNYSTNTITTVNVSTSAFYAYSQYHQIVGVYKYISSSNKYLVMFGGAINTSGYSRYSIDIFDLYTNTISTISTPTYGNSQWWYYDDNYLYIWGGYYNAKYSGTHTYGFRFKFSDKSIEQLAIDSINRFSDTSILRFRSGVHIARYLYYNDSTYIPTLTTLSDINNITRKDINSINLDEYPTFTKSSTSKIINNTNIPTILEFDSINDTNSKYILYSDGTLVLYQYLGVDYYLPNSYVNGYPYTTYNSTSTNLINGNKGSIELDKLNNLSNYKYSSNYDILDSIQKIYKPNFNGEEQEAWKVKNGVWTQITNSIQNRFKNTLYVQNMFKSIKANDVFLCSLGDYTKYSYNYINLQDAYLKTPQYIDKELPFFRLENSTLLFFCIKASIISNYNEIMNIEATSTDRVYDKALRLFQNIKLVGNFEISDEFAHGLTMGYIDEEEYLIIAVKRSYTYLSSDYRQYCIGVYV